jgi:hypothetical protein
MKSGSRVANSINPNNRPQHRTIMRKIGQGSVPYLDDTSGARIALGAQHRDDEVPLLYKQRVQQVPNLIEFTL